MSIDVEPARLPPAVRATPSLTVMPWEGTEEDSYNLWRSHMLGYHTPKDENGEINNVSVSTVTAISLITGCEDKEAGWEFMYGNIGNGDGWDK